MKNIDFFFLQNNVTLLFYKLQHQSLWAQYIVWWFFKFKVRKILFIILMTLILKQVFF